MIRKVVTGFFILALFLSPGWVWAEDGATFLAQKAPRPSRPHVKSIKELEKQAQKQNRAALKKKKKMEKAAKRRNTKIKEAMEEMGGRP